MKLDFNNLFKDSTGRYYRFAVYIIIVILINLAGQSLFVQVDLTGKHIYSLSRASREVVSKLKEPLTIKVFFTRDLPAPYNGYERYLKDLLQEYASSGNSYFNYEFYDSNPEEAAKSSGSGDSAESYGIYPVQVQELENNEMQVKQAYMGIVFIHGNIIDKIPSITSTEGLEYQITSKIRKMNNKISALLNADSSIDVDLYLSGSLNSIAPYLNLKGFDTLRSDIEKAVGTANQRNYGKLKFSSFDPSSDTNAAVNADKLKILKLSWPNLQDKQNQGKLIPAGTGYIGISLSYKSNTQNIDILHSVNLGPFGTQYQLTPAAGLADAINDNLDNILDINEKIGYLTSGGTLPVENSNPQAQQGQDQSAANFKALLEDNYSVEDVDLSNGRIPDGIQTLIIAGPKSKFTDYELYQIDQFLMKGKSVAMFLDAFNEFELQNQQPVYIPVNTGLENLADSYGVHMRSTYAMDENCYIQSSQYGNMPLYFAPLLTGSSINSKPSYMKNLKEMIMITASPLEIDSNTIDKKSINPLMLLSTSGKGWEMEGQINLNPMMIRPPSKDKEKKLALAYIMEGPFKSYFSDKPVPSPDTNTNIKAAGSSVNGVQDNSLAIKQGKPGKIFITGTSAILKDNVIDQGGKSPDAVFALNVIDYLNGKSSMAEMRAKSQDLNPIRNVSPQLSTFLETLNIAGLPVLVVLAGLLAYMKRSRRRKEIEAMFTKK